MKEQLQREGLKTGESWVIDEARSQKRKGGGIRRMQRGFGLGETVL